MRRRIADLQVEVRPRAAGQVRVAGHEDILVGVGIQSDTTRFRRSCYACNDCAHHAGQIDRLRVHDEHTRIRPGQREQVFRNT